jgi:hypothetical protein
MMVGKMFVAVLFLAGALFSAPRAHSQSASTSCIASQ